MMLARQLSESYRVCGLAGGYKVATTRDEYEMGAQRLYMHGSAASAHLSRPHLGIDCLLGNELRMGALLHNLAILQDTLY